MFLIHESEQHQQNKFVQKFNPAKKSEIKGQIQVITIKIELNEHHNQAKTSDLTPKSKPPNQTLNPNFRNSWLRMKSPYLAREINSRTLLLSVSGVSSWAARSAARGGARFFSARARVQWPGLGGCRPRSFSASSLPRSLPLSRSLSFPFSLGLPSSGSSPRPRRVRRLGG